MDGNRRWAKKRKLPIFFGHYAGYKKLKKVILWAKKTEIKHIIIYAFSTENWERNEKEINALMGVFENALKNKNDFKKNNIKTIFIGQINRFPERIKQGIKKMENSTKNCDGIQIYIAISYGGRAEIISVINDFLKKGAKQISEKEFSNKLWTINAPDPNIIIRTGGEKRLSNFLPWQGIYSELFFTDTLWPEFTKNEFKNILSEYAKREKRKGK